MIPRTHVVTSESGHCLLGLKAVSSGLHAKESVAIFELFQRPFGFNCPGFAITVILQIPISKLILNGAKTHVVAHFVR